MIFTHLKKRLKNEFDKKPHFDKKIRSLSSKKSSKIFIFTNSLVFYIFYKNEDDVTSQE